MSTPHTLPPAGPGAPTPPIAIAGGAGAASPRLGAKRVDVPEDVIERLRGACAEVTTDRALLAEASRDWWPLAMSWATEGQVAGLAGAVARPLDLGGADLHRVPGIVAVPVRGLVPRRDPRERAVA